MKSCFNKQKNWTIILLCLFISNITIAQTPAPPPAAYPNGTQVSFIRTWDAVAPEFDPNNLMTRPIKDVKQATQYFDGLGRPIQTVMKRHGKRNGV
jgi:hypothetical protein